MTLVTAALGLATALCPAEKTSIEIAADAVQAEYVIADHAETVAASLRRLTQSASPTDACREKEAFASELQAFLRETSDDPHYAVDATTADAGTDDWVTEWYAEGKQTGYGVERVEILEGNIGFVRISSFYDLEHAGPRLAAAFELISETDGLILDLRRNGGGSPETADPLVWSFLPEDATPPLQLESRLQTFPKATRTPPPWGTYGTGRPLVVLIDARTFSAPEAVSYSLQSAGRAIIVGEPSGGGAHMLGDAISIGNGLDLYIPDTRPVSPVTGTNWEGQGVLPDHQAPSETALQTAHDLVKAQLIQAQ